MTQVEKPGVLYISSVGLLEPLGQSQVAAYLVQLAKHYRLHVLSFEKAGDVQDRQYVESTRTRLRESGVTWHQHRYRRLVKPAHVALGAAVGARLIRKHQLNMVHARSYVPGMIALTLKRLLGTPYIFDMRGFWADERVDGGIWPANGALYKTVKRAERSLLREAAHVVSLTHAAVTVMKNFDYLRDEAPPFTVISTCADLTKFKRTRPRRAPFTMAHVGSVGTWYQFDDVARVTKLVMAQRPGARLLVLNKGQHDEVRRVLRSHDVPLSQVTIRSVPHADVAAAIQDVDLAIFFIKPVFSKIASAPTKLAEFLGCGIPSLTNDKVGDVADLLRASNVGVTVSDFEDATLAKGVSDALELLDSPGLEERCRAAAELDFSLRAGVERYLEIYRSIIQ